jgi:Protein of unknown function, DUF417
VAIGLLTLVGLVSRRWGLLGPTLAFPTPFVTLSFFVTTPEAWVPALGDAQHVLPYLPGAGREIVPVDKLLARAHGIAEGLAKLPPLITSLTRVALTQKRCRIIDEGYWLALEGISSADVARARGYERGG